MLNEIDLSRADLNLLVLFEAVLEERHVGRAAERLNLTLGGQPGLGRLRRLLNDPLFLRTPKGVVPTARAMELAAPIADVLARVRSVISTAEPFDPATSTRRFTIGAPDGVSAVFLPPLLAELRAARPASTSACGSCCPRRGNRAGARLAVRLRRAGGARDGHRGRSVRRHPGALPSADALRRGFRRRDARRTSVRGRSRRWTATARCSTWWFRSPAIRMASSTRSSAKQGRSRRIALTVPNFMFALAVIAETDLISALPRRFVAMHAARFGVVGLERRCRCASGSMPSLRRSR